jgi:hypothetical protein
LCTFLTGVFVCIFFVSATFFLTCVFCGFDLVFLESVCVGSGSARSLSFSSLAHMFPWGFDLVFWNQFSVGSGSALSFLSSLACSLEVFDLVFFGISLVWGRDLLPFPFPHLRMFLGGFDLVFWNQFGVGSGSARSLSLFSLARVPLVVFF